MLSLEYWITIIVSTASFTLISIFSKAFLNKKSSVISYKSSVPLYLSFSAVFAVLVTLFITGNLGIPVSILGYSALMGLLYCIAAFIVLFSLENEKVALIGTITSTQFIILSFFSAVFFAQALIVKDSLPSAVMLAGVFLLAMNELRRAKFSKFVIFALLGNVAWVMMWLVFYATIPAGFSPFVYYAWLAVFAAVFAFPFSFAIKVKRSNLSYPFKSRRLLSYIVMASLFNGLGSVLFSFAYKLNTVYSPLFDQISIPALIVLSFVIFREKLRPSQIIGAALIVVAVFILVLI